MNSIFELDDFEKIKPELINVEKGAEDVAINKLKEISRIKELHLSIDKEVNNEKVLCLKNIFFHDR